MTPVDPNARRFAHAQSHRPPAWVTTDCVDYSHRDPRLCDIAQPRTPSARPKTVEGVYRRLVSILEAAVYDRRITHSPAIRIKLPKINKKATGNIVTLNLDDVHRIADAAPPWMTAFTWTIDAAGLRPGEAAGLTLERVDFMR